MRLPVDASGGGGKLLELDDVALGIAHIDRKTLTARPITHRRLADHFDGLSAKIAHDLVQVASLDPEAADDIMRLLRRLATRERIAVLCVLHQVELAYAYADRVVGIRDGRMAFDRACAELPREAVRQLYLNEAA